MITGRIIGIVIGYLFGLIQTGYLYGKIKKINLREHGSGNSGMTNSLRVMGWKAGVIVCFGDCFKAIAAMLITWLLFRNQYPEAVKMLELYAGLGAILGHNYPCYLKFKGGKGIACSVGIIIAYDPLMVPICAALFFLTVIPTGFMSLGSLCIMAGFFAQTVIFGQMGWLHTGAAYLPETYILTFLMAAMGFWRHRENIKRLLAGTENKFRPGKKKNTEV